MLERDALHAVREFFLKCVAPQDLGIAAALGEGPAILEVVRRDRIKLGEMRDRHEHRRLIVAGRDLRDGAAFRRRENGDEAVAVADFDNGGVDAIFAEHAHIAEQAPLISDHVDGGREVDCRVREYNRHVRDVAERKLSHDSPPVLR